MSLPGTSGSRAMLARDTTPDIEQRQIDRWREMSPVEKAALVSAAAQTTRQLAVAGICQRYPDASERERFLRLAMLTLGPDLALAVYPDAARLAGT
jgi:hypothetical protein